MKPNPEYFIEQVKYPDDKHIRFYSPQPIRLLQQSQQTNENLGIITIAIFKIYPKNESKED